MDLDGGLRRFLQPALTHFVEDWLGPAEMF
jgi:hypothetical protein